MQSRKTEMLNWNWLGNAPELKLAMYAPAIPPKNAPIAYAQVSSAPPAAPAPAPDLGAVAYRAQAEFEWFRTELPHDPRWWKGAAKNSSENFRVLTTVLSRGQVPGFTH